MSEQITVVTKVQEMIAAEVDKLISADTDESTNIIHQYIKKDNEINESGILDICESIEHIDITNQDIFENVISIIMNEDVGPDYVFCIYEYNKEGRPKCYECPHNEDCCSELRCDIIPMDFIESGIDSIASVFHEVFVKDERLYGELKYNEYDFAFDEFIDGFAPYNSELVTHVMHKKASADRKDILVNHAQPLMFSEMFSESDWGTSVFGYGNNLIIYDRDSIEYQNQKKNFLLGGK